ncbi:TauD/TfdA family dioxygenase [Nocardia sp. CNY236]|uniref:TauD/TfdA family dioxygenase n=1 Tax=Nocardia sp. CNY236 TaxID=1169152 RepID=UPI000405E96D|nr:TauD/TfdA family dioxygenase [Nocardia sp. CNY236]
MKSVLSQRMSIRTADLERRELPEDAARAVCELAREIVTAVCTTRADRTEAARTLADPTLVAHIDARLTELPAEVSHVLRPPATAAGAAIIGRIPLVDSEFGTTPPTWQAAARWCGDPDASPCSFEFDLVMLLLARCAGEPFGWQGQQDGRLVNNIVPTCGHEHEQSGASSTTLLSPHTEDAFHPRRANLLMLGCLRNPDAVGTTVSSVRRVQLSAEHREILSTPTLPILPDVSYGTGYERGSAIPVPILWSASDPDQQTIRYDPAYTPLEDADPAFRSAYGRLAAELERVCTTAALAPGELLLMDNDVAVHGRAAFTARYDGTDRWLKRVNIRRPERRRRAGEAAENGYGQRVVAPFRAVDAPPLGRSRTRDVVPNDRGSVEHS